MDEDYEAGKSQKLGKVWACNAEQTLFWAATPTVSAIGPGLYKCTQSDSAGHMLKKLIISTDDLIVFDDDAAVSKVLKEIELFWARAQNYRNLKLLHKRGLLMTGDPGSGKTSCIQQLIQVMIKLGGIAVYADDPYLLTGSLQVLRQIEPERPVIVILEDFETLTENTKRENEWLSVLDGEAQINNVVFLATTNYVEKLDKRFTDRPSRFDTIMNVPMPSAKTRAVYLLSKIPFIDDVELDYIIQQTKGFSIAHLKELVVSVFCLNDGQNFEERKINLDQVIFRLQKMRERKFTSEDANADSAPEFGFLATKAAEVESPLDYEEIRRLALNYSK